MRNWVPSPRADCTSTVPPARRTTSATVARPSPVPRPTPLVVKNGSKMRCRTSSGMPGPVSRTVKCTSLPSASSERKTSPPWGIASRALTMRFITTCSNWLRSIFTTIGFSGGAKCSVMLLLTMRRSNCTTSPSSGPRSCAFGCTSCRRLKLSSCRHRSVARRVASSMACRLSSVVGAQLALREEGRFSGDDGEQVVEVVRHAAGQQPHRFHLLRLHEVGLELLARRDVASHHHVAHGRSALEQRRADHLHRALLARVGLHHQLGRRGAFTFAQPLEHPAKRRVERQEPGGVRARGRLLAHPVELLAGGVPQLHLAFAVQHGDGER